MYLMRGMGPPEAKMMKGGYHTLITSCISPVPDKEFSYIKSNLNLSVRNCQNSGTPTMEKVNSSQPPHCPNGCNANANPKKKKKRRRRGRRKGKNQSQNQTHPRQRTISVQSDDNFIVFVEDSETTDFGSSDSILQPKKVRFAADDQLCEVHPMVAWSYAYQAARRGPWEEYARDRCRFARKIDEIGALIGHIFAKDHRSRIFEERFAR